MFRFDAKLACRLWRNLLAIMAIYVKFYTLILTNFTFYLCRIGPIRAIYVVSKKKYKIGMNMLRLCISDTTLPAQKNSITHVTTVNMIINRRISCGPFGNALYKG